MPLRDHFHPPLSKRSSWEGVHGGWPMVIIQHLVRTLPDRYIAEPRVHLGSQVEVDVSTYDTHDTHDRGSGDSGGGRPGATGAGTSALWAPAEPTVAVETELADADEYAVHVYDMQRDRRLVAAIELVSPANKDRPESRAAFVAKCEAMLRQRVSVVLVDLVTLRDFNLYAELLEWVGSHDAALGDDPPATYAAACRWGRRDGKGRLEAWGRPLVVGEPLPALPLWLSDELAVPLELEASYEQTCRDLRIA